MATPIVPRMPNRDFNVVRASYRKAALDISPRSTDLFSGSAAEFLQAWQRCCQVSGISGRTLPSASSSIPVPTRIHRPRCSMGSDTGDRVSASQTARDLSQLSVTLFLTPLPS